MNESLSLNSLKLRATYAFVAMQALDGADHLLMVKVVCLRILKGVEFRVLVEECEDRLGQISHLCTRRWLSNVNYI